MTASLTDLEKKVIALLQTDIPVCRRPYLEMAERIGITEEEFIKILSGLNDRNMIRRFGATLKHQKSGFKANAMVAWKVPEERVEEVGNIMASFHEITHCYPPQPCTGMGQKPLHHGARRLGGGVLCHCGKGVRSHR